MADDTDLLDGPEINDSLAIRPNAGVPTPTPPDVAPPAAASPAMPIAPPVQPNMKTAILGSVGARPDPNAPQYQPVKPSMGKQILGALSAGALGFKNPALGVQVGHELSQAPIVAAQQKYGTDVNDYNARFNEALQTNNAEQEDTLRQSQENKNNAEADKAERPSPEKLENVNQGYAAAITDAVSRGADPATDPHVMAWKSAVDSLQKPEKKTAEDEAISDYEQANKLPDTPANRDKARETLKTRDRTPRQPTDREEWQKDHPGEPIENYWTAKAGAGAASKNQAAEESKQAAQQYADDYIKGGNFTGPGDEALMEKYFELAKPSSGFRMTQPQIEMLTQARDTMDSIVAKGKHYFTPEAPYFSTRQREQIVKTMSSLQQASDESKAKSSGGKSGGSSGGGKLSLDEAKDYLQKAGGDKDKARAMAKKDGRSF